MKTIMNEGSRSAVTQLLRQGCAQGVQVEGSREIPLDLIKSSEFSLDSSEILGIYVRLVKG